MPAPSSIAWNPSNVPRRLLHDLTCDQVNGGWIFPFEKYAQVKMGSSWFIFPNFRCDNSKQIWKHHLLDLAMISDAICVASPSFSLFSRLAAFCLAWSLLSRMGILTNSQGGFLAWIWFRWLEKIKVTPQISNGGLMVIYHGRIRRKEQKHLKQANGSVTSAY